MWPWCRLVAVAGVLALLPACGSDEQTGELGDVCGSATDCASGRCDEQICKAREPAVLGGACEHPLQCRSERCIDGRCAPGVRPPAAGCTDPLQCASGRCDESLCTLPVDGGLDDGLDPRYDGAVDAPRDGATAPDAMDRDASSADAARRDGPTPDVAVDAARPVDGNLPDLARDGPTPADGPTADLATDGPGVDLAVDGPAMVDLGGDGPVVDAEPQAPLDGGVWDGGGVLRFGWCESYGGTERDEGKDVDVDVDGNIYVVGNFAGAVNFGGNTLEPFTAYSDVFIASYTAEGVHRWSYRYPFWGFNPDSAMAVAVAPTGDVYITGADGSSGSRDLFILHLNTSGANAWAVVLEGPGDDWGNDLAVDASGNVYVVGEFEQTVDFGGGDLTSHGYKDIVLLSYDSSGQHRWSQHFGSTTGNDYGRGVALHGSNLFITGVYWPAVDFGGGPITAQHFDAFVASFTTAGAHRWSRTLGGPGEDQGRGVAVGPRGEVYVTGNFAGSAYFGGNTIDSAGIFDIFVASYTADGIHRWSTGLGGMAMDWGDDVVVDGGGNVYLLAHFQDAIDPGGGTLTSAGEYDPLIVSFTDSGTFIWAERFGGALADVWRGGAVDDAGNLYATGLFQDVARFGRRRLTSAGGLDIVLLKLVP